MRLTRNHAIFLLGLAIPAVLAFRALLVPGHAVWGDAPYFYPEALREFVTGPFAWMSFGNNFGGVNSFLFIYPLMFLYGSLHFLLGFSNDILIRLLFYFPAVILAFASPVFFARYLGYSCIVQFFASLVYGLNTYFLLIVDGGQVGVALAYGLFPLALLSLHYLVTRPSFNGFWVSLLTLFLLIIADLRFAVISLIALLLWIFVERLVQRSLQGTRSLYLLLPVLLGVALLSAYWLAPLLQGGTTGLTTDVSELNLVSLINPLFLFQPHWPANIFGAVSPPPFYFALVPFLVFGCLLWRREKAPWIFAFLILILAFLLKGETPPLGGLYGWAITSVPFGSAFRDSTKFFTPLILFSGILVGLTIESVGKRISSKVVLLTPYAYLLFLLHPAFTGGLNGVLASRAFPQDFEIIHQKLTQEESFFRTAWFPERPPLAFHSEGKPALDAKRLVDERSFATLNAGTFDAFNFLHNDQAVDWLGLLGVKYVMLSGNPRKVQLDVEEQKDWDNLLSLVDTRGLKKIDWGTSFPVYRVSETKPRIFATNKLVAVVGADDIYERLKKGNDKFSIGNQGLVFFEDGKFNPRSIEKVAPESVVLVLNDKNETDLAMSFLQKYFVGPSDAKTSQWAVRDADDYLRYKYELLINKVDIKDFDYGKGIAFSTVRDEEISWDLDVARDGDYTLAVRTLQDDGFSWGISNVSLRKEIYPLTLKNDTGFKVVNAVALIPKDELEEAQRLSRQFINYFDVVTLEDESDAKELTELLGDTTWQRVEYEMASPVRYKLSVSVGGYWLTFTDSYHPNWKLKSGVGYLPSLPLYSMINGFYFDQRSDGTEIVFRGQESIERGIYLSIISLMVLTVIFIWFHLKRKRSD